MNAFPFVPSPPPWVKVVNGRSQIASDAASVFAFADLIRRTEEELLRLFSEGLVAGTTHTCLGQEICQLAVVRALRPQDYVLSNHRNHGHLLAFCGDFAGLLAEVTGREGAINGGRGGSQHIAVGRFHSNGVQGGMSGIATGLALAARLCSEPSIVTLFLGDGSLGEGLVYEAMNLAAVWSLPVLFVVERNGIAQTTPTSTTISGSLLGRGKAFGLQCWQLDDTASKFITDAERIVDWVRTEGRPGFLVIETARMGPHSKGDDLRSKDEIAAIRARDPLAFLRSKLGSTEADHIEAMNRFFIRATAAQVIERPPATERPCRPPFVGATIDVLVKKGTSETVRESLNAALRRLLVEDERVVLLGEDLHDPYGGAFKVTAGLSTEFPGRVLSTPISEGAITGAAIGLAIAGRRPVLEIMFADFLSLCMDQLYNHASKFAAIRGAGTIPMVVRAPSGGRRGYGPTHSQSPEALVAAIPGMTVVCPHHRLDAGLLLQAAVRHAPGPLLFAEHKLLYGRTMASGDYLPLPPMEASGLDRLFPTLVRQHGAPDLIILTYGGMLAEVEEAVRHLEDDEELSVEILVPSLLSPLPVAGLSERVRRCDRLMIVEEGPRSFGIGAEIISRLSEAGAIRKVRHLGMEATIIPAARHLETEVIPGTPQIIAAAVAMF